MKWGREYARAQTLLSQWSVLSRVENTFTVSERNPGMDGAVGGSPALSLHAGYSLLRSPPGPYPRSKVLKVVPWKS